LLGKSGTYLWKRAHGRASANVQPHHDPKGVSAERTFNVDSNDTDWLRKVVIALNEKLAFDLRSEKKMTSCVAIKIRYNDFSTHSKQTTIPLTSNSKLLMETALRLFNEVYDTGRKVRLIGVRFTNLEEGHYQINMFDDREKDILLYKAIDDMKSKYGKEKLVLAQNLNMGNIKRNDPKADLNKEVKRETSKVKKM
jgi:DNA polymerase-4